MYAPTYLIILYLNASSATSASLFPSAAAFSISLKSDDIPPLIPSTPDFLLRIFNTSSTLLFSLSQIYCTIAGSISPDLVPMIRPSRGVRPIDESIHLPPIDADIDAPFPR